MRNPFDSIVSFWNLMVAASHIDSVPASFFTDFPKIWSKFIEHELGIWLGFYEYWLQKLITNTNSSGNGSGNGALPILVLRYEDVVDRREHVVPKLAAFLDLYGYFDSHVAAKSAGKNKGMECLLHRTLNASFYKPRSGKTAGSGEQHFPPELRVLVRKKCAPYLCRFGYGTEMALNCSGVDSLLLSKEVLDIDTAPNNPHSAPKPTSTPYTVNRPKSALLRPYLLNKKKGRKVVAAPNVRKKVMAAAKRKHIRFHWKLRKTRKKGG